MNDVVRMLVIVCPLIFLAGFVDAVAGGGGVISLPAYLFAGLPAHIAAGTNKLSAGFGTIMAAFKGANAGSYSTCGNIPSNPERAWERNCGEGNVCF